MDALECIRKRRSVRSFTGAPVPRADLERIVDAGRLAATGSNRQPWTFIAIADPATIEGLRGDSDWAGQSAAMIAVVMDPSSEWWREDGAAATQNMLLAATALGYGACWIQGHTRRQNEAFKALLGIPPDRELMTLVALGAPKEWPEKEKKTLAEVLRWDRYG